MATTTTTFDDAYLLATKLEDADPGRVRRAIALGYVARAAEMVDDDDRFEAIGFLAAADTHIYGDYTPSMVPIQRALIGVAGAMEQAMTDINGQDGHEVMYGTVHALDSAYAALGHAIAEWKDGLAR